MAFVSEDRRGVGLLLEESLEWNIAFTAMQIQDKYLKPMLGGLFKIRGRVGHAHPHRGLHRHPAHQVHQRRPRRPWSSPAATSRRSAWPSPSPCAPDLLFVSEPTRGIDIGAKRLVLDALHKYNRELGMTIVMVSSELEELRSICDRIAIVDEGRVTGILPPTAKLEEFGLLMTGEREAAAEDANG